MADPVVVEQFVAAKPEEVHAVWTSADSLARWWWPHIEDTRYVLDARVGGSYRIYSGAAGIGVEGEFRSIEPPASIDMTWRWLNDGVPSVEEEVNVRFMVREGGTLVRVVHEIDDSAGEADNILQGWVDVLSRLAEVVGDVR